MNLREGQAPQLRDLGTKRQHPKPNTKKCSPQLKNPRAQTVGNITFIMCHNLAKIKICLRRERTGQRVMALRRWRMNGSHLVHWLELAKLGFLQVKKEW